MKLIELHILQSFPVSCLNRDDVGSPKSAIFGGVSRARISSQCLKRAIRNSLKEESISKRFKGDRGRFIVNPLMKALKSAGMTDDLSREWAIRMAVALTKVKKQGEKSAETEILQKVEQKLENSETGQVSTAVFLSPLQIEACAMSITQEINTTGKIKSLLSIAKAASVNIAQDGADISIFGRMIAADTSLNLEGAAMFSHALSTHQAGSEIDYFSAVEEYPKEQEVSADSGAAMIGTLEFTSATYYRYCAVNLDLLARDSHLGLLSREERREVLEDFLRAALLAVPGARRNSMNAATLPDTVLGVVKEKGQPLQLINAFEDPVPTRQSGKPAGGLTRASAERMKAHHEELKKTWGITTSAEVWMPESSLGEFLSTLLSHV